ncbi:phage tail protein [Anabaena cylindrica FACHB-243]|uniref:Phage tail protein n=1 Tax=Anabaena cylindrica (strain ATCC 27899 / PCC 7122) TaxID=272123 RepID=K9ZAP3_ANACC|nr:MULTISPECIES: phage tail protein [Anabaena]AFZ55799.1 phage tail protein [Anabaena cylindrica PCC 7122]MBD2420197.1 phage tail protein [Anabaena cylindrica FACHB-243]MBY5283068.1 phage tail protein [Anabaena sp. CCAP 1446/1C]MBY5311581.1 phage tail protein [Anabaena sp. CCAP 1446/1C]MCM2406150.1 phage tail protein [Anabaena sp. CCAP 1446/1C]
MEKEQLSSYLEYLPAYLETDPFVGRFLLAFEGILSGFSEEQTDFTPQIVDQNTEISWGLETLIDQIHTYFDPQQTPGEFLPWLAGWVALSLRDDWDEKTKRQFISNIVPLYQIRGTVPGMRKMLEIYLESSGLSYPERTISIFEFDQKPHYFQVQLALPSNQVIHPERYWREFRIAKGIIDQEKPAHTYYALRILTLTMQITQAWGSCYPFILFDAPPQQKFKIEARIKLNDYPSGDDLEKEILIRIQGKNLLLEPNGSQMGPHVRQTVFYQQFIGNPDGFFIALANLSDRQLTGKITVQVNFNLNHQQYSHIIFDSVPFDLEPNLRIYRPLNQLELMPGNTRLDSEPEETLNISEEPPLNIHQPQIKWIDGNTRLGDRVGQTMRLVHDARLRIYKPRQLWQNMEGNTRLGNQVGASLQIPTGADNSQLKIYRRHQENKIGNTFIGTKIGATMRLVPNSQWLERIYRFKLFDSPVKKKIEIEAIVELTGVAENEGEKIARLLTLRIQSCTSTFRPLMPDLEFSAQGLRATHKVSYQQFIDNPKGFYVVVSNINDRPVSGKITIKLNFNLNQKPVSQVILEQEFHLSPRVNVLEICRLNNNGQVEGNTIIGRVTPQMLRDATMKEEAWVD